MTTKYVIKQQIVIFKTQVTENLTPLGLELLTIYE